MLVEDSGSLLFLMYGFSTISTGNLKDGRTIQGTPFRRTQIQKDSWINTSLLQNTDISAMMGMFK